MYMPRGGIIVEGCGINETVPRGESAQWDTKDDWCASKDSRANGQGGGINSKRGQHGPTIDT